MTTPPSTLTPAPAPHSRRSFLRGALTALVGAPFVLRAMANRPSEDCVVMPATPADLAELKRIDRAHDRAHYLHVAITRRIDQLMMAYQADHPHHILPNTLLISSRHHRSLTQTGEGRTTGMSARGVPGVPDYNLAVVVDDSRGDALVDVEYRPY